MLILSRYSQSTRNVTVVFAAETRLLVINDVSFTVRPHESAALLQLPRDERASLSSN